MKMLPRTTLSNVDRKLYLLGLCNFFQKSSEHLHGLLSFDTPYMFLSMTDDSIGLNALCHCTNMVKKTLTTLYQFNIFSCSILMSFIIILIQLSRFIILFLLSLFGEISVKGRWQFIMSNYRLVLLDLWIPVLYSSSKVLQVCNMTYRVVQSSKLDSLPLMIIFKIGILKWF